MIDDNLKLEFEDKLQNIISKARETDIDKGDIAIYCSSFHALLMKYLYANECRYIVNTIRDISNSGNPDKFILLIDMLEEVYCSVYEKKPPISESDKDNKIYDITKYLDENEICEISGTTYYIIGGLVYTRYVLQRGKDTIKMGHKIADVYGNSLDSLRRSPMYKLKYSFYEYPTKTEVNRYISALLYLHDTAQTDVGNISNIFWGDVVKYIRDNGIESPIDLERLTRVNFNLLTKLRIVSVPEGASIWLDERNTGWETNVEIDVKPGKYVIDLKMDGYRDARKELDLTLDKFFEVEFRFEQDEQTVISTYCATYPDVRYLAACNNIVKDTKTGLEWLPGPDQDTNWNEAKSWVAGLKTAGNGWRMPIMDELENLYKEGVGDKNITLMLETTGRLAWSGETEGSSVAWLLDFLEGDKEWDAIINSENNRVFAVRSQSNGSHINHRRWVLYSDRR